MLKRLSAIMIALIMCAALAACGNTDDVTTAAETADETSAAESDAQTEEATGSEATESVDTENVTYLYATEENSNIDPEIYLDYAAGIENGVYAWFLSEDGTYYELLRTGEDGNRLMYEYENKSYSLGTYTSSNITNEELQQMIVYVPSAYMKEENGAVTIDTSAEINGYNAATAPIIYENICYGGDSSRPEFFYESSYNPIDYGYIFVVAGARSRSAVDENGLCSGKVPTALTDLKAGLVSIRANADVIPGDKDKIIALGQSGAAQMSVSIAASGNMEDFYPYMYEAGVAGMSYSPELDTYYSEYSDSLFACAAYSAIDDVMHDDLAHAWMWYDTAEDGGDGYYAKGKPGRSILTSFQIRLQEDEAVQFAEYLNSLNLKDLDGNNISFDEKNSDGTVNLRGGSYYEAVLNNLSNALNAFIDANTWPLEISDVVYATPEEYINSFPDDVEWITKDGSKWKITSLRGYMIASDLVNGRNKSVPAFDSYDVPAENSSWGYPDQIEGIHYSTDVGQLLRENFDDYAEYEGFDEDAINKFIDDTLVSDEKDFVAEQVRLMDGTQMLLDPDNDSDIAKYWRVRNGVQDQHTSFSISYNLALAANMNDQVAGVDYAQVWGLGHSSAETADRGTGSFVDWVDQICK